MDQNSNMGGFAPMQPNPSAAGFGGNNPTAMPGGVQAAPNPVPNMGATTPSMPGVNPMTAGVQPANPAATATQPGAPAKKSNALMETVILVVVCLIAAVAIVFAVIFFMQYNDLKNTTDSQVGVAVAQAIEDTQKENNAAFAEKEKLPFEKFVGPSDYGSISFEYPKTWSAYIAMDGADNSDYQAYFRPKSVEAVENENSRYALRFIIRNEQITTVQQEYDALKEQGVTASVFNADNNKISGVRYEGMLSEGIDGIVVVAKVNDKTVILQTDVRSVYAQDFESLLSKLRRNS